MSLDALRALTVPANTDSTPSLSQADRLIIPAILELAGAISLIREAVLAVEPVLNGLGEDVSTTDTFAHSIGEAVDALRVDLAALSDRLDAAQGIKPVNLLKLSTLLTDLRAQLDAWIAKLPADTNVIDIGA